MGHLELRVMSVSIWVSAVRPGTAGIFYCFDMSFLFPLCLYDISCWGKLTGALHQSGPKITGVGLGEYL